MYPPKINGDTGPKTFPASIEASIPAVGAAKARMLWLNIAAPAAEVAMNSRRFIVTSLLLEQGLF